MKDFEQGMGGEKGLWVFRGQAGFERELEGELKGVGVEKREGGEGWMVASPSAGCRVQSAECPEGAAAPWVEVPAGGICFSHEWFRVEEVVEGESVNALAGKLLDVFLKGAKGRRFEGEWACVFRGTSGLEGLGRRVDGVERAFLEKLKERMGRVARLAVSDAGRGAGERDGFYVFFSDFGRALVGRKFWVNGQRRMADDALAPSRSYLKVEEAYGVLDTEPKEGERVVDLGAAPGGWSYSAAKRGARVVAVDNGPLKGGALGNELIEHVRADAFGFGEEGEVFDWMFCDLVEEPHHVLEDLVRGWIEGRRCRSFVVIFKFGRVDALRLLGEVRERFGEWGCRFEVRHLYHCREEFAVVGVTEK